MTRQGDIDRLEYQLGEITRLFPGHMKDFHGDIDDLMSTLRMQIKYALFDIEALHREIGFLRSVLDRRNPPGGMPPYQAPQK